jgi:hypothetical protein
MAFTNTTTYPLDNNTIAAATPNTSTTTATTSTATTCSTQTGGCVGVIAVFIACFFFFVACWIIAVLFKTRRAPRWEQMEQQHASERLEKRNKFIQKALVVREWAPDVTSVAMSDAVSASGQTEPVSSSSSPSTWSPRKKRKQQQSPNVVVLNGTDTVAGSFDDEACCAICLISFQDHDLICESNNEVCKHIFHKDCIVSWLLKHEGNGMNMTTHKPPVPTM